MFASIGNKPAPAKLGRNGVNEVQQQASAAPAVQTKLAHMLNGGPQQQTQRRLQSALDQSPRAAAQAQLVQMMADAGRTSVVQKMDEQELADEEELIQSKSAVQRQEMPDEDELLQQMPVQRQEMDEDELMQMQRVAQRQDMTDEDELLQKMRVQRRANTTGMPDQLKAGIEGLSGLSMDNVQVHYNSSKPASLQAHAYTQGSDIHVAPGQERHLAHEAWHVVQQSQGRVQPTMQMQGTAINDDAGLESEADVMGARALQMVRSSAAPAQAQFDSAAGASGGAEPRIYQFVSTGAVTQLIYLWDRKNKKAKPEWSDDSPPEGYLPSGRYDDSEHGEDDVYARLGGGDLFYGISYEEGEKEKELNRFFKALKKIGKEDSINIESSEGFAKAIRIYESEGGEPVLDVVSMNALFGGSSGWERYSPYLSSGSKALVSEQLQKLNSTLPWAKSSAGLACQVVMIEAIKEGGSVRFLLDGMEDIKGILEGSGKWSKNITADELRFSVDLLGETIDVGDDLQVVPQDGVNVFFYLNRKLVPAAALKQLEVAQALAKKLAEEEEWDEEDEQEGLVDLMIALASGLTAEEIQQGLQLP